MPRLKTILLVDDRPERRRGIEEPLRQAGYELRTCGPQEAVDCARAQPPDLILVEMMLPAMRGFEVLSDLRRDPLTRKLPVVMLRTETAGGLRGWRGTITTYLPPSCPLPELRPLLDALTGGESYVPEHWTVRLGNRVVHQPGAVLVVEGVPFVEHRVLEELGLVVRLRNGAAQIIHGARRAVIPVGVRQEASIVQGFRHSFGRIYLPIEELHRQGAGTVVLHWDSRWIELSTDPPAA